MPPSAWKETTSSGSEPTPPAPRSTSARTQTVSPADPVADAAEYVCFDVTVMHKVKIISFFFNDTATTEIYTLSLHDALPIYPWRTRIPPGTAFPSRTGTAEDGPRPRSEEHTSELQSRVDLVCRLLLEKK